MWPNPHETADLATFTEEILNGKIYFCAVKGKASTMTVLGMNFN